LLQDQGFTIPGAKARLAKGEVNLTDHSMTREQISAVELLQGLTQEIQTFREYIHNRY
jgi:hypothetical protein